MAIATAWPHADVGFAVGWTTDISLGHLLLTLGSLGALLGPTGPVVPINSNVAALSAAGIVLFACTLSRPSPLLFKLFLSLSWLGVLAFFYTKYLGSSWHHGMLFVALVMAMWLERILSSSVMVGHRESLSFGRALPIAVLFCQAVFGLLSVGRELYKPYSNGHAAAQLIVSMGWNEQPIIAVDDASVSTIVGYLHGKSVYYVPGARWGTYVKFDLHRLEPVDINYELDYALSFGPETTVISTEPLEPSVVTQHALFEVAHFSGAIVKSENYVIYRSGTPSGRSPS
jgi:hypothetical protein